MLQLRDSYFNYKVSSPAITKHQYLNLNETDFNGRVITHYFEPKEIQMPRNMQTDSYQTTSFKKQYKTSKHLKRRKRYAKKNKIGKKNAKFIVPAMIGFLAATTLLIPVGIKALILVATKALVLVLLSTLTALFIRMRGAFVHQNRRRADRKSGQQIIQNPYDLNYYYKRKP